jgi:lipopolysaccharide export system ATP-binding protein
MTTLRTEDLKKCYGGRCVVDDVCLEVNRGEVVGLLGPNGAGKTTTFHIIVGLVHPDSGRVLLDGRDISRLPMYQRARGGISYLPQEPSIFRKLTVEENLLAILETLPMSWGERRQKMETLLNWFGLHLVRKSQGYMLSGGERRRVEIARSLVISPGFILLDEPFSGIDPLAVLDIQRIIAELKREGIGVLVTDHNVRETLMVTDRAYIINNGGIFRSGTPYSLSNDREVQRVYLGEGFTFSGSVSGRPAEGEGGAPRTSRGSRQAPLPQI